MGYMSDYYKAKDREEFPENKKYESDNPQFDHLINNLEDDALPYSYQAGYKGKHDQ